MTKRNSTFARFEMQKRQENVHTVIRQRPFAPSYLGDNLPSR